MLLIHLGGGHSLHETVVRARQANLAELSAVALWNRLKKSQAWLRALCVELFRERGLELSASAGLQVRAIDATTVKEPGKTGSLWRVHYSVCLPSLACDFFKLTETQGAGTGESFVHFPIRAGDYLLADRGYSTAAGIRYVADTGGRITVRVNTRALPLRTLEGRAVAGRACAPSARPGKRSGSLTRACARRLRRRARSSSRKPWSSPST